MGHIRNYEFFDNCGKSNARNRKAAELELGWTIFENSDQMELGYGYGVYPSRARMRFMAEEWVTWVDRKQPFETVSAAKEWLDGHVDYGAKVVPVKVPQAVQESSATKKLVEREPPGCCEEEPRRRLEAAQGLSQG